MTEASVGKTAKRAFEFMQQFYRDVQVLVSTFEQHLATENLYSTQGTKIADRTSNSLLWPDQWMPEALTRIYARQDHADRASQALALSIEFAPQAFDEPICLIVGVRFPRPSRCKDDLWDRWMTSNAVLAMLPRDGTSVEIPHALLVDDFMPKAQSGRAFAVPLCDLSDAGLVTERLVAPALALLR